MKSFNFYLVATLVAFSVIFSSCDPEGEITTVSISLDKTSFDAGSAVTGSITALGGLKSVTLLKGGTTVTGWPLTTFAFGSAVSGSDGAYSIRIDGLDEGEYTLRAVDKSNVEDNKTFTVVGLKTIAAATTIYCTLADGSGKSTCASADGTTYEPKNATVAQQAKIDFVYFNLSGTSLGIYSPSSVPAALTTTFANWTTKNATTFAKTTSITYANATYLTVKTAADAATATSVTGLAANDVVVFKTAGGKVGLFKVNSITAGYLAADNVNINIKVQP